jgi:AmmeMemoRadiSam system protein B
VIASGDLAHVGPAFGGAALDPHKRGQLRAADDQLLSHMAAGDRQGFFSTIRQIQDRNNVCGVAPIYLTMQTIHAECGESIGYATCPADAFDTSVVTIGGMIFQGREPL